MRNAMRWMMGAVMAAAFVPALAGERMAGEAMAAPTGDDAAQAATQAAPQGDAAEAAAPRTGDEGGGRGEPTRAAPRAEAATQPTDAVEQWNQERFLQEVWTLE